MDKRRVPRMTLSLVLSVLAVLTLTVINEVGFRRSTEALEAIDQSLRTRAQLHRLMQLMLDAETGPRGFLLTGEAAYLQPYEAAIADMDRTLQALHALYPPAGEEAGLLAAITADTQRKLAEMALSVRMRQQGREEAWKFVLMSDVGRQHMDAIRAQANRLIGQASARVAQHQAQVRYSLLVARLGIAAVALAALVAFVLYLRQTRRLEAAGERQQRALERERDQLEQLVRERTASLAELATHLQQVREQERGHLARELHDELGALLTAAKLDVARLRSRLGDDAPDTAQRLQHLVETLNRGIALKRRIIEDLRPSSLANLGLAASLEILVRDFCAADRPAGRRQPRGRRAGGAAPAHRLPPGPGIAHQCGQVRAGPAGGGHAARLPARGGSERARRRQGLRRREPSWRRSHRPQDHARTGAAQRRSGRHRLRAGRRHGGHPASAGGATGSGCVTALRE